MAIKSDYISGTLTITQGQTTFTGTGTGWSSAEFKEGDTLIDITGATEFMGVIESITGEGSGTLTKPWEGPSLVNVAYRMRYQPDGSRSTAQARNLIEILGNGNITAFASLNGAANLLPIFTGPGSMQLVTRQSLVSGANYDVQVADLAARAAYDGQDEGYAVLVSDVGDGRAAIYSKLSATSGDWSEPAYVTGRVGPVVTIEAGVTTTLPTGQDATFGVRPVEGGYELDAGIPRGLTGAPGANGAVGATGPRGEGLQIDATGTLAERADYDNEAEGFSYVDVENGNLYFKVGSTPGVWSDPIPFGKGDKGDPGTSGAEIVTTNGVGNGTEGPYTLNEAPASLSATWASISGVEQYDFSLAGDQITFGLIVPVGIPWQVKSSGVLSVITPADGSITGAKINTSDATNIRTAIVAAAKPASAVAGNLAVFDANREVQDIGISKATTTQAQTGTNDTAYMTPLKTAQAILTLSPPTDLSSLEFTVSQLALLIADINNVAIFLGESGNRVADTFDTLTYVDVAGATNLDTSTVGVLKPTIMSATTSYSNTGGQGNRVGTITVSTTFGVSGGSVGNLIDGNETPGATNSVDFAASLGDGEYIRFDFGTAKYIDEINWRSASAPGAGFFKIRAANTIGTWTELASFTMDSTDKVIPLTGVPGSGFRYYDILKNTTQTQSRPWYTEVRFKIANPVSGANNLTVRSAAFTAITAPTKMKALIQVRENETAVAGTDYTFECSRDNGTTWNVMTLTEKYSTTSGLRVVDVAETSVTGQPTGLAPRWRFKTLNNKNVELHDVYLYWSN